MAEQNDTATKKAELEEKNTLFRDVFIGSVEAALKEGDKEEMRRQLGPWSPKFVKSCATKFLFMLVFSLLAIVQGSSFTYFSATITTLEKRLKISSETATIMLSGNEVSQILFSIPMSYLGGTGHRPRWMGLGVLMSSLSCFLLASPHFIYGPGDEALSVTFEFYDQFHIHANHSTNSSFSDSTESGLLLVATEGLCDREGLLDAERGLDCDTSDQSWAPLILIFISQFIGGIGMVLFFTLGGPYIDDNMKQTHMPFIMGLTSSFRLIGPVLGFLFGYLCLRIFISPTLTPTITADSPKWIGAWWLGWVVLGFILAVFSILISVFPKKLKKSSSNTNREEEYTIDKEKSFVDTSKEINHQLSEGQEAPMSSFTDMKKSLGDLLRNKVNLFNTIAGVFYLFPMIGFGMFAPKYLESIYKTSASGASLVSSPSIAVQALGLIISGALISIFQPSARKLAGFNIFTAVLSTLVLVLSTQITCHQGTSLGFNGGSMSWKDNLTLECNKGCNCKQNDFDPICFKEEDRIMYSSCQAGCLSYDKELGIVGNCSCLPNPDIILERGTCADKSECQTMFYIFVGVRTFVSFIDSFGRIGNMLIGYRCVDPKHKSLAIGLVVMTISLFASLPSPVFFGAIIDSVCLLWGTKCGGKGNCLLYDSKKFVYAFNFVASGFLVIGVFFDCLVFYHVKTLDLYDESKNIQTRRAKENPQNK